MAVDVAEDGSVTVSGWPLGMDNRSSKDRLPEGAARDLVNLDAGDTVDLRAGYSTVYTGTDIRGALSLDSKIIMSDNGSLVEYDTLTQSTRTLRSVTAGGGLAGAVLNKELFFCTANESLRYDGNTVRRWGVPTVTTQPAAKSFAGIGTPTGNIMVAVTLRDAYGVEGGTTAARVVTGGPGLDIEVSGIPTPPSGGAARVYVSAPNSTTLYFLAETTSTNFIITGAARDNQRALETQFEVEPPQGSIVAQHMSQLLIANGSTLWITQPMRPHAVNRVRGFFSFAAPVRVVQPVTAGVYISADATYFLSNLSLEPALDRVYDAPIQAGSAVAEAEGTAVWLSDKGYMRGSISGAVSSITGNRFAPLLTSQGASGTIRTDGREMVVTTLTGVPKGNPLGATDFFQTEIIRHE